MKYLHDIFGWMGPRARRWALFVWAAATATVLIDLAYNCREWYKADVSYGKHLDMRSLAPTTQIHTRIVILFLIIAGLIALMVAWLNYWGTRGGFGDSPSAKKLSAQPSHVQLKRPASPEQRLIEELAGDTFGDVLVLCPPEPNTLN